MKIQQKLTHLIKKVLYQLRFSLSSKNSLLFKSFYQYWYKPREGSLSQFLNEYSLSKKKHFCVIQVGANDGITHDPIHKFIKRDEWKGVLVEPQKEVYEKYLEKIYKNNQKIHTICAAIGEKDGTQDLYKIGFCDMRWATGLASFQKSNLEKAFSSGLVEKKCAKYGIALPKNPSHQIISEKVKVLSPESLLKKYQINQIDLLQIDTEGYDYQIIRLFNIAKTQPQAIIFENAHLKEQEKSACRQLLLDNHYKTRDFGANTLAMKAPVNQFEKYFE